MTFPAILFIIVRLGYHASNETLPSGIETKDSPERTKAQTATLRSAVFPDLGCINWPVTVTSVIASFSPKLKVTAVLYVALTGTLEDAVDPA
ncbi:MAG: hypothetical protein LBE17_09585 [Treponema sp.]|jgi:hypothetical protein|nr:hypothetical protein [Treponema sp.]